MVSAFASRRAALEEKKTSAFDALNNKKAATTEKNISPFAALANKKGATTEKKGMSALLAKKGIPEEKPKTKPVV